MNNLPYHIVVSNTFFHFEEQEQLEEMVEIMFCHATDRRDFYEKLVTDCATVASRLIQESGDDGAIRSSTLITGLKIIVDKYGKVYDPGEEFMKITACDEG
jgi:hypothetical protein